MVKNKIYGYLVSGSRIRAGRFYINKQDAHKEMKRQMLAGASESGIMEVMNKKDARTFNNNNPKKLKMKNKKYWK